MGMNETALRLLVTFKSDVISDGTTTTTTNGNRGCDLRLLTSA